MTTGHYCTICPFCGGGKKKKMTKKTKAFYGWATTGIPVKANISHSKKMIPFYEPLSSNTPLLR